MRENVSRGPCCFLKMKPVLKKLAQVRLQDLRRRVIKPKDEVKLCGFRLVLLPFVIALSYLSRFNSSGLQQTKTLPVLVGSWPLVAMKAINSRSWSWLDETYWLEFWHRASLNECFWKIQRIMDFFTPLVYQISTNGCGRGGGRKGSLLFLNIQ